jgi:hypothetical protein
MRPVTALLEGRSCVSVSAIETDWKTEVASGALAITAIAGAMVGWLG